METDQFHDEEHRRIEELLPWYVTGRLDPDEFSRVGAHVASCSDCQAEVRFQQRLQSEIARLPLQVEAGWAQMRRRIEDEGRMRVLGGGRRPSRLARPWLGWGIAAVMTLVAGVSLLPSAPPKDGTYHALSARPAAQPGNLVVIFRPDTTEQAIREMLNASQTRLVDGPTAADAYVLHAPSATRNAVVATLRANRNVVLAQPIDP